MKVRTAIRRTWCHLSRFQSTHPWRCERIDLLGSARFHFGFNPRTREGANCSHIARFDETLLFQSTHPWRCELFWRLIGRDSYVSIHAPVKVRTPDTDRAAFPLLGFNPRTREGANMSRLQRNKTRDVSIHAPVKVRTPVPQARSSVWLFQSTHPWRCERYRVMPVDIDDVSIHAPVMDANQMLTKCQCG